MFGTLTVEQVIASGGTALAVAAEPTLGKAGYVLMSVTALVATAGATNGGLYPATGLSDRLAETGQFPGLMGRRLGGRASAGLLIAAAACLVLALFFNLDAIASIGSAVALLIFTLITAAHFRVRTETGANVVMLSVAVAAAGHSPVDLRVHDPHPRAGLDRRVAGHSRAQCRSRLRVETGQRQQNQECPARALGHLL